VSPGSDDLCLPATDGKYKGGDHIPGMNVGGWYDAGDFDLEEPAQLSVIQSLALAYLLDLSVVTKNRDIEKTAQFFPERLHAERFPSERPLPVAEFSQSH